VPFVWQLYPQNDGAHAAKLDAFLDHLLDRAPPSLASLRELFAAWNGLAPAERFRSAWASLDTGSWADHCRRFSARSAGEVDLTSALLDFVALKR
jgi:hypothetical protein